MRDLVFPVNQKHSEEVVVVAAQRWAAAEYPKYEAYICQAGRQFRETTTRLAFYCDKKILRHVPRILGRIDKIPLRHEGLGYLASRDLQPYLLGLAADLLKNLLAEPNFRVGREDLVQIILLSPPAGEETVLLDSDIPNDKVDKNGNLTAFTQAQRYVSLADLKNARTTANLDKTTMRSLGQPGSTGQIQRVGKFGGAVIQPVTPFANLLALRNVLRSCTGYIWWADPHFAARALEELHMVVLDHSDIAVVYILSGRANVNDGACKEFRRFRDELQRVGIVAEWRVLDDFTHDRFITSRDLCVNVPPVNTIFRGSYSEFNAAAARPPFAEWWSRAKPIPDP